MQISRKVSEMLQEIEGSYMKMKHINLLSGRLKEDYIVRNNNIENGDVLCEKCGGTGNAIFLNYLKCPDCSGFGVKGKSSIE